MWWCLVLVKDSFFTKVFFAKGSFYFTLLKLKKKKIKFASEVREVDKVKCGIFRSLIE